MAEFQYYDPFPLGKDETVYRHVTGEHVSVAEFDGREVLKVELHRGGGGRREQGFQPFVKEVLVVRRQLERDFSRGREREAPAVAELGERERAEVRSLV